MENKEEFSNTPDLSERIEFYFSKSAELACYKRLRSQIIKLLYMIENEAKGGPSIEAWFYGFVFELVSSNQLCRDRLTEVVSKIHGLYNKEQYKQMTHQQVKRQIMESRGIIDHLINDVQARIEETSNN